MHTHVFQVMRHEHPDTSLVGIFTSSEVAEKLAAMIREAGDHSYVACVPLDLWSPDEVRAFRAHIHGLAGQSDAVSVLARRVKRADILVNIQHFDRDRDRIRRDRYELALALLGRAS